MQRDVHCFIALLLTMMGKHKTSLVVSTDVHHVKYGTERGSKAVPADCAGMGRRQYACNPLMRKVKVNGCKARPNERPSASS